MTFTGTQKTTSKSTREADVGAILKLMATALKNKKTYSTNNPVLQKSLEMLHGSLAGFLAENGSLTLLVREADLIYGHCVVYSCSDKMESLAFALYKDGIRLMTFREGLSAEEIDVFLSAIHEAREVDPYQADVVTILWEKDLANITYRAVDAYLENDERRNVEELARKYFEQPASRVEGTTLPSSEFFIKELGLSPGKEGRLPARERLAATDSDTRSIIREILEEDEPDILRNCSEVCLEIIKCTPRDDTFNRVVDFLGRICDWLVASGDFLSACSILSDLRSIAGQVDLPALRRSSIMDTIAKRGERKRIRQLEDHLYELSESQMEEIFAYLALMSPDAVDPLCEMLAECEVRKVRYILCRAISLTARNEPDRLRRFLQDERWFFVRNIVMILGMTANPEGIEMLRLVVSHPEPRVRREVARSLGKIKSPGGLDLISTLLRDTNKLVRFSSLAGMRDIGGQRARQMLEDMIVDKNFGKMQADEKTEVMKSYGSLGAESFAFLDSVIRGNIKHLDEKTRASAVYGVAMTGRPEIAEMLMKMVNEGSGALRYAASEALAMLEPRATVRTADGV